MDLGDLEFKEADFQREKAPNDYVFYASPLVREWICSIANRILRDKLTKAREVFSEPGVIGWLVTNEYPEQTHRARLVCIAEIKK
jgi:hypothetical protein